MKMPILGMAALVLAWTLLRHRPENPLEAVVAVIMALVAVVDIGWFIRTKGNDT